MRALVAVLALAATVWRRVDATRGVALTPPMGWSSWTSFGCAVTGANLTSSADSLVSSGLAAAGYRITHVDDCWMTKSRTGPAGVIGHQIPNPDKFPDGIQPVIDHIHGKGLLFGIYTARGSHTCQGFAASCLHELQDAAYYKSIGVDFLKDDSCSSCAGAAGDQADVQTDYERMQMSIDAVGANMSLFVEGQPDITVVSSGEFGNGRRVGHDISPTWWSMMSLVDIGSGLWPYAHTDTGKGSFFNWLDFLQVGKGDFVPLSADPRNDSDIGGVRARSHVSLFSALKSPLFLGNRLDELSPAVLAALTPERVLAVNQDAMAVQARRVQSDPPSNASILLDGKHGMPLLAKCDAGDPLQQWRFTPGGNESVLVIESCDAADPAQQWSGVGSSAAGSSMRNKAAGECLDAATAAGYQVSSAPCAAGSSSQDFWLEGSSSHMRLSATSHCLDIFDFRGPNVFVGSCKPAGDEDSNQIFAFDASSGLIHATGSGVNGEPPNSCLALRAIPGGKLWMPVSAGHFEGASGYPAVCLSGGGRTAGQSHLEGCDPNSKSQSRDTSFVLTEVKSDTSTGSARIGPASIRGASPTSGAANYSIHSVSSGIDLAWNSQFGASGPLPHTRWLAGGSAVFTFDPTTPSPIAAIATDVIDDDGVGHVTKGGGFCIAASRGGNLEVWAGPLSQGRFVVVLVNRASATETITAQWSNLPASAGGDASLFDAQSVFAVVDAWTGDSLGSFTGSFSSQIPSLGSRMLILTPAA